jgi:hypothetical protein
MKIVSGYNQVIFCQWMDLGFTSSHVAGYIYRDVKTLKNFILFVNDMLFL